MEYNVCIPITGVVWVTVEADSEDEAIELAMDSPDLTVDNIEEWETHKRICDGNVLYAQVNEAYAEEA